jgi:hypothetical protein
LSGGVETTISCGAIPRSRAVCNLLIFWGNF